MDILFKQGIWTEIASFLIVLAAVRTIVNRVLKTINLHVEVQNLNTKLTALEKMNVNQKTKLDKIDFMLKMLLDSKYKETHDED